VSVVDRRTGRIRTYGEVLREQIESAPEGMERQAMLEGVVWALRLAASIPRIKSERDHIGDQCTQAMELGQEYGYWKVRYPQ
jgi:hypothetical protein